MGKKFLDVDGSEIERFQLIDEKTGFFHDEFLDAIRKILNGYLHGQLSRKEFHNMWVKLYNDITKMIDSMHDELDAMNL